VCRVVTKQNGDTWRSQIGESDVEANANSHGNGQYTQKEVMNCEDAIEREGFRSQFHELV